ncbi:hypothetical protein DBY21_01215 [Candidatus Gastranaerophilales bacterium]|nr:MAG: hypothetical protein DBY21_01215 [Candidatus Gastranaerophilales bacterium]
MQLPEMLHKKDYIVDLGTGRIDKKKLLEDAYAKLCDDFYNTQVHFEGYRVILDSKILDCSVCNYDCVNDFCECSDCPWRDKLDIFQHITSDEDPTLKDRLTKDAKKLLKKKLKSNPYAKIRTPGEFSSSRTFRIPWIKYIIEHSNDRDIQVVRTPVNTQKTKIKLYNKKENYLVILSQTKLSNGFVVIYLNSAYHKPFSSLLRDFK